MNRVDVTDNVFVDIVENSPFGITILKDDKIIYANKSFSKITGYSFNELNKINFEELITKVYGEFKNKVLAEKQRILQNKTSSESIFKITHKNGTELWLKVVSIYIDYEGKPAIQSTYFDVSERQKTEEGLIRTNAILNNLIKTSPLGIIALDKIGKVVIWNPGAEKIFGWKEEEVLGKKVPIIPNEDWRGFYERFNKELSGQFQVNAERYRLKKDGSLIPVRMSTAPLQDSNKKIIGSMAIISDISTEKEAEETLKETQERFTLVLEATNDAIWDYDFIKNSIWRNKNYEVMFGYRAENISNGIEQAFNKIEENERENVLDSFLKAVNNGKKYWDAEYNLIKKSGETVIVLDRAVILYDELGNPVRAIGSMTDISDIRKSETELKYQSSILKNVKDAIVVTDQDGKIKYWNSGAEEIFGYKSIEMIGNYPAFLYKNKDSESIYKDHLKTVLQGKDFNEELELVRKNGKTVWVEVKAEIMRDSENNSQGIIAILRDISDRIQANQALIESEEKYRNMVEDIDEIIFVIDNFSRFTYLSPTIKSVTGYEAEELLGKSFMHLVHSDDKNKVKEFPKQRRENSFIQEEWRLVTKNSEIKYVRSSSRPILKNGKIKGLRGIINDITDLKKNQQELKAAKEKAELSDKLKSEFLAQVSHEIRTPLNTMLSFSSLIKEELQDKLDEDLKMSFHLMENSGKRIIRTIELILNLSELQVGTFNIQKKIINLYPILFELIAEHKQQAEDKGLNIEFLSYSKNVEIEADEYSVYQIFENLIDNAVKYTEKGSIRINISKENKNIIAEVSDTGIGMNKEFLPFLFQPFTQEEQGYTRKFEGNGLGLALVKNYCDLNGAEISVESEKEKGSTFRVIFSN